ncbi:hypothetical protein HaLaN_17773 [Haematococcus lacustris]|uniref:Uncharacterized protein n=1 Tax=Haematococcus lacustris TaxID=44745 RepID=A0A699ZXD4_HAELA|nr:hypothetical protein HaLaN_17773 [Haematococcus lacustris]
MPNLCHHVSHHLCAMCAWPQLEKDMAKVSMERHGRANSWPRGTDQRRGRVVLVDEHRTTRVSSAMNGNQPCEVELDHEQTTRRAGWKSPSGQVDLRLLCPAWSQQRDQPVRGLMWCPVVAPYKPPQAPQEATQPAASKHGPNTPPPAKCSKRTEAEHAAEPRQPTKGTGKGKGKAAKAKPAPQPGRPGSAASQGQGLTISALFSCPLYTVALAVRQ